MVLRQFSDLRVSYDGWLIHRHSMTSLEIKSLDHLQDVVSHIF